MIPDRSLVVSRLAGSAAGLAVACGRRRIPCSAPHERQYRTLAPSAATRAPSRVALPQAEQTSSTFDTSIGISLLSRPPWGFFWLRRMWRYTRLTPSTTTIPRPGWPPGRAGWTAKTLARVPRSLPVRTSTRSPVLDQHHTTSLARLTIFMKFRSRSSRATAPKMRVPLGFLSLSMITQAFESNRT